MAKERWAVIYRCRLCLTAYVVETITIDRDADTVQMALSAYRARHSGLLYHNCSRSNSLAIGMADLAGLIEEDKWHEDQKRAEASGETLMKFTISEELHRLKESRAKPGSVEYATAHVEHRPVPTTRPESDFTINPAAASDAALNDD